MDVQRMRKSFDKVASFGDEVPLFFYSHLFLSHPETRAMFPVSMMQQRDRLFRALGHVVAKVDDLDTLVPFLQQLGRDHRKFGALAAHYPAVGASLLTTLEQYAGDDWTPELAADWAAAYGVVADVMVAAAEGADDEPAWWDAEVVAHERCGSDLAVLRVRTDPPLPYEPGQSVTVQTDLRPRLWRTYSVANAPTGDGVLELHVRARDGGPVSGALVRHTSVGSVLRLGPPLGLMVLDPESDRDLLLVGIGTGMAPLKALVQQVARLEIPRRVDFFVGARSADGFYDLPALRELEQQHPWLHVVLVATRQEDPQGAVERGAMVDVVLSRGPWSSRDVYLSGARDDVRALKEALVQARVAEKRIKVEEFTPSSWSPRDAEGAQSA
jgi:NAD(P)H-flavin reductase/hemoglobin-like flavoprotein